MEKLCDKCKDHTTNKFYNFKFGTVKSYEDHGDWSETTYNVLGSSSAYICNECATKHIRGFIYPHIVLIILILIYGDYVFWDLTAYTSEYLENYLLEFLIFCIVLGTIGLAFNLSVNLFTRDESPLGFLVIILMMAGLLHSMFWIGEDISSKDILVGNITLFIFLFVNLFSIPIIYMKNFVLLEKLAGHCKKSELIKTFDVPIICWTSISYKWLDENRS